MCLRKEKQSNECRMDRAVSSAKTREYVQENKCSSILKLATGTIISIAARPFTFLETHTPNLD